MSEWQTVAIGEICDLVTSGGTPLTSQKEYYHNGSIPWVKTKEVNQCRLYGTENHITQLGLDNSSAKLIPENSIIIAMYGDGKTAGRVALNKVPVTTNQACCNLILNKQKANYDFVFYNLMGRYDELVSKKTGSGQQNLNGKIIKEIEIDLPPLPEQKAIASVLSSLDDKIDLLHRQNKTLEAMAETLFRQWFIEEAKEDWNYVELGSVIETSSGGTPSRKVMSYYEDGSIYWVKSKELNGSFINHTEEMITEEAVKKSSAKLLPAYSTLIAMYGATVGEYALITKSMTCNQAVCAVKENELYPYTFIFMYVKHQKDELINQAVGSAQQNISQILIKKLPIPTCTDRIREYHSLVNPWFKRMQINVGQTQTLEQLRDILLPKLMNGEVKVKWG